MKVCPVCRKSYNDDNLNFCLEDGSLLTSSQSQALPETVLINQPRMTDPTKPQGIPTGVQPAWSPQQFPVQQKKSRAWIWALGILGLVILICGGGFAGLMVIGIMNADNTASNGVKRGQTPGNTRVSTTPVSSTPSSTPSDDNSDNVQSLDLSEWVRDFSVYGTTEFTGGELLMASKQKAFYYVLLAPDDYSTEGAATRVTMRNVDDGNSTLGYGLIFHSNPSPLIQDYAFLLDAKKKRYRVVRHEPQKETALVPWTNSSLIKDGAQENTIEAKDKGEKTELYINGQLVNSVNNTYAYKGGVPGLYSGDAVKIAFKNLEIRK